MAKLETENLLGKFQSNVYPKMLEALSEDLGVSVDSLRRLGLGWCPIVEFKKGKSFCGWWVIPERDDYTNPLGLSLRNDKGDKTNYPGSKHGCIYAINPDHKSGEKGYSAGPHNWVRTLDAGILCPVCGRPDGCLLSQEDPAHPKAVVCIREKSPARLRFGYLHLLKPEANFGHHAALANNGGPVLIVEGMSDTAAAMDLGFDAVGKPSNLAGNKILQDLVRGRDVIIMGENDAYERGGVEYTPGYDGMVQTNQNLKNQVKSIRMIMPPPFVKDLRAWKVKHGLTRTELLAYVDKHGREDVVNPVIEDDRPTTVARAFIGENFLLGRHSRLRYWNGDWYVYHDDEGKYVVRTEDSIIQPLYQWAYTKLISEQKKTGETVVRKVSSNPSFRASVIEALLAETRIADPDSPCWINGFSGQDPKDLIVFGNGILDVTAFLAGEKPDDCLREHTQDLFTLAALPLNFNQVARCPTWDSFLLSSLGDEQEKILLLQEWMGYCMTTDTSMQKGLFMRGPTAAGKSRVLEVMDGLIGKSQTAWVTLKSLAGNHGTAELAGKMACFLPDARTPKQWDAMTGLEILLSLMGDDKLSVNRKFCDAVSMRMTARVTIASNEFLEVADHAGALARRLNFLEFNKTFKDNPDTSLPSRLMLELPGIANWALQGLRRLRRNKTFTVPPSSVIAIKDMQTSTNPIAAFIEECCDCGTEYELDKDALFDAWDGWSNERRFVPVTKGRFYERVRTNSPFVSSDTYEKGGHKFSVFKGIQLKAWAVKQYTRKP